MDDQAGGAEEVRIPPLGFRQWPPQMREVMAALRPPNQRHEISGSRPDRPKALNVLGTIANHIDLMHAWNHFNGHVLYATTLSERQRELLILRIAAVRGSEYEWIQHSVLAGDLGITPQEVARVADGPDADGWSPLERALLAAVDELLATARIAGPTWKALAGELDHKQLLDVIFTVGAYDTITMVLLSCGVPIDDDLARWGER